MSDVENPSHEADEFWLSGYVPLRVHSEYSLVDSLLSPAAIADFAAEHGLPAIALTDRDNIFGSFKFAQACAERGIQAILGADISIGSDNRPLDGVVTLLVQNELGFRNLSILLSHAQSAQGREGPRLMLDDLRSHSEGLIVLSGTDHGLFARLIDQSRDDVALATAQAWAAAFPGRFYIEVDRHNDRASGLVAPLLDLAAAVDLPVVATNPARMASADQAAAHAARLAIARGTQIEDERPHQDGRDRLLDASTMQSLFADLPEAVTNSVLIAQRCAFALSRQAPQLPDFPDSQHLEGGEIALLRQRASTGLDEAIDALLSENPAAQRLDYEQRLAHELDVIDNMGFPGYFLIVGDFVNWAVNNGVPVGPGRGSGAGSLVAFCLGITKLDPLRYDLLFERFLNPERVSMPDFDIDFCMNGRDRVIDYVTEKYGSDHVSRIITYGRMAARSVIRDVGRVHGQPYGYVDRMAKLIPFAPDMTLERALSESEDLATLIATDADARAIFEQARTLEGLARNAGKHAGGIVIAPRPIHEFTPTYYDVNSGQTTTQFDMKDVEGVGLVKFDFLGLRTLTIIDDAVRKVNRAAGPDTAAHPDRPAVSPAPNPALNIDHIPLDDPATFQLLNSSETTGVFQLESAGMKKLVHRLQPTSFEDIIALVALFRPGPLQSGMVDDFIDRKHGLKAIEYPHDCLASILEPTYGVILYQEQVMQIAQTLSGYSLGEADLLRRAMGKKKPEEMARQRAGFEDGAVQRGVERDTARRIFDLVEKFAGYGFNKSHSAAYALLAYQTAYIKARHPAAFLAATLSADMDKTDKVAISVREARRSGLTVAPPDVNNSHAGFDPAADHNTIRYGLGAIKGLGSDIARAIIAGRTSGPYRDLVDLCKRVPDINHRALQRLVYSGACDDFADNRASLEAAIPLALKQARQNLKAQAAGQADMFGDADLPTAPREAPAWSDAERMSHELEALGLFLSCHPMDHHGPALEGYLSGSLASANAAVDGADKEDRFPMTLAGTIRSRRDVNDHAFLQIEDIGGELSVAVFSDRKGDCLNKIEVNATIVVEGTVSLDDFTGTGRMIAESVHTVDEALARLPRLASTRNAPPDTSPFACDTEWEADAHPSTAPEAPSSPMSGHGSGEGGCKPLII